MARRAAPMARVALLCAALLVACSGDEAPAPAPDAAASQPQPQPLLALGTVLHAPSAPADAHALEVDALVYLRCYATSTQATPGSHHPDSMLLDAAGNAAGNAAGGTALGITPAMLVAAASASRGSGLHATLPVEAVASPDDVAGGAQPAAGGNAYTVGDWAALGTADLWCELYDIDRANAGLADAMGGALLRAADFAAAGTDQLRCAHRIDDGCGISLCAHAVVTRSSCAALLLCRSWAAPRSAPPRSPSAARCACSATPRRHPSPPRGLKAPRLWLPPLFHAPHPFHPQRKRRRPTRWRMPAARHTHTLPRPPLHRWRRRRVPLTRCLLR